MKKPCARCGETLPKPTLILESGVHVEIGQFCAPCITFLVAELEREHRQKPAGYEQTIGYVDSIITGKMIWNKKLKEG
jgi:hypothetical protein